MPPVVHVCCHGPAELAGFADYVPEVIIGLADLEAKQQVGVVYGM